MKNPVSSPGVRASSLSFGVALFSVVVIAASASTRRDRSPIKIAVFDFELEDYSAGGGIIGETPEDIAQLKRATDDARQLLAQSGRYSLVDVSRADAEPVRRNRCGRAVAARLISRTNSAPTNPLSE